MVCKALYGVIRSLNSMYGLIWYHWGITSIYGIIWQNWYHYMELRIRLSDLEKLVSRTRDLSNTLIATTSRDNNVLCRSVCAFDDLLIIKS